MGHLKAGQGRLQAQPLSGFRTTSSGAAGHYCKYSMDGCMLSPADRQFYEENGFLVVKGLVGEENLRAYQDRFKQICRKEVKVNGNGVLTSRTHFTHMQLCKDLESTTGYCSCLGSVTGQIHMLVGTCTYNVGLLYTCMCSAVRGVPPGDPGQLQHPDLESMWEVIHQEYWLTWAQLILRLGHVSCSWVLQTLY